MINLLLAKSDFYTFILSKNYDKNSIAKKSIQCNWRIPMSQISITKGLNLPFTEGADESISIEKFSKIISIDLSPYTYLDLKLTKAVGDFIEKGEVIVKDVHLEDRVFLSHTTGKIVEVIRGERRKITSILIEKGASSEKTFPQIEMNLSKEGMMEEIFKRGASFFINKRPLERVINKGDYPSAIFIHTVTSAPYTPSFRYIMDGNEEIFAYGISILKKFGEVDLIYNDNFFSNQKGCRCHKAIGPHPIESSSLHISALHPISSFNTVIWSINVYDVLSIGSIMGKGSVFSKKVIALAGSGFSEKDRILIKTDMGSCIEEIAPKGAHVVAGNPLTGKLHEKYLRRKDYTITSLQLNEVREILPFIKPSFMRSKSLQYKLGGEKRPFILKDIYQKHFPFHIYIEPLIKAILAKDFDLAISLGFLEIEKEDLCLAEYMCPSKISLMAIYEEGKKNYLELQEK